MSLSANRADTGKYSSSQKVRAAALIYLGRRHYAKQELKEKLLSKGAKENDVDTVIESLVREGILDENKMVEAFIHNRKEIALKGPAYVYRELLVKGIEKDIIISGLDSCYDEEEQKRAIGILINKELRSHFIGIEPLAQRMFWHKLALKLQRKGFSTGLVMEAIEAQKRMLLDKSQDK